MAVGELLDPFGNVEGLLTDFLVFLRKAGWIEQQFSSPAVIREYWRTFG